MKKTSELINWSDFSKIEMRVGTVLKAEIFKEAKKPAYKIEIDFGDWGIKKHPHKSLNYICQIQS